MRLPPLDFHRLATRRATAFAQSRCTASVCETVFIGATPDLSDGLPHNRLKYHATAYALGEFAAHTYTMYLANWALFGHALYEKDSAQGAAVVRPMDMDIELRLG